MSTELPYLHQIAKAAATNRVSFCVASALLLSASFINTAWAAPDTNVYGNRINPGDNDPIYLIDLNTGGLTTVANSLFPSASLARSPVSGLLYYTEYNVTNGRVATWDPDTDIHTIIGNVGAGILPIPRLGFRSDDVLYATDDACELYTVNKINGSFTSVGTMTGVECDAGDLAFGADDTLYVLAGGTDDTLIWTVNLSTLVGTQVHDVQSEQGLAAIAFADAGAPNTARTTLIHYSPTWVETTIGTFAVGLRMADLASSPIYADLSLGKVVDNATPDLGDNVVFTLTVTNAGPANATGVVVTDLLPSGYTYVSDDGGDYDDATGLWTVGAVATSTPETLNITATVLGSGTHNNGAEITAAGQFDSDSTPNNDVLAEDDQVLTTVSPALPVTLVKRAFWSDGTSIPSGVDIPSGVEFKFLLYINNPSVAINDVSVRDVLDPAFQYQTGTIQVDNTVGECALAVCTAGEEQVIFTTVDGATFFSDAVDSDVGSYTGASSSVDAGNGNVANVQLDINADAVWAILFSVKML